MSRGIFITFDGLDGTGKSTQLALCARWLEERGHEVVTCRDPGTTPLGERLRAILLEKGNAGSDIAIAPRSETLLYMAARAQLVAEVIDPALAAGRVVLSDRFVLANVVYQAHGLGLPSDEIWRLNEFPTQGLLPDATIVLDLDIQQASARRGRSADRIEDRDLAYQRRVREGFLAESAKCPDRVLVIDADDTMEEVQRRIRQGLIDFLELKL